MIRTGGHRHLACMNWLREKLLRALLSSVACLFALGAVGCGGDEPAVESDPSELSAPADPSDPTSVDDPSSPSTDASDPVEPGSACEAWEQAGSTTWHADTFAALSDGVSVNPVRCGFA